MSSSPYKGGPLARADEGSLSGVIGWLHQPIAAAYPLPYGRGSVGKSRLMIIAIGVLYLTLCPAARADDRFGPHWSQTGCTTCHPDAQQNRVAPVDRSEVTASCMRCHDGHKASAESHPVGRLIESPRVQPPPADWPTPNGLLSCLTCHYVRFACDRPMDRPKNPGFLRGEARGAEFCGKCHIPDTSHDRYNPHDMRTVDGRVDENACTHCHESGILSADRTRRSGDPMLHAEESRLCLGCHGRHVDYFDPGHMGAAVPAAMLSRIKQQPHRLPLAEGDTVTCSTCHNPHAAGIFPPQSELAAGAMQANAPADEHPLRGYSANLCGACHAP